MIVIIGLLAVFIRYNLTGSFRMDAAERGKLFIQPAVCHSDE